MNSLAHYVSLALTACCMVGCISAQVEFEDVEITRQNVTFPGLPADLNAAQASQLPPELRAQLSGATSSTELTLPVQQFAYSNASSQVPSGLDGSLTLKRVTVASHDPQRNLSFLHSVMLTSAKVENPTRKRVLLSYTADPDSPNEADLVVPVVGSSLTIDPWQLEASVFELTVSGSFECLPREAWAVDVTLSLAGEVEYNR
jgi:hypothetical protein